MRWLRRGAIAAGWLVVVAALVRLGSGGGGTAENIRYAITDLPLPVAGAALATFAGGIALVVGALTDRRVGLTSLAAAALALAVGVALDRAGHGSGTLLAIAAGVIALLSLADIRADRAHASDAAGTHATAAGRTDDGSAKV